MDLFCPHCSKKVSVPDDKAGMVMSCPLCTKQFMAPSLAPPTVVPPPPPPPISAPVSSVPATPETFAVGPAPSPPPKLTPSVPIPPPSPAAAPLPPPPPPGEYTRTCACELTGAWIAFVPIVCAVILLILSFFPWYSAVPAPTVDNLKTKTESLSMWGLAFTEKGQYVYLAYTLLMFPAGALVVVALLFQAGVIPPSPGLAPVSTFKHLAAALMLAVPWALLTLDFVQCNLSEGVNPISLPLKIGFRVQALAIVVSLVLFWLDWRKQGNLPAPKCDMRW